MRHKTDIFSTFTNSDGNGMDIDIAAWMRNRRKLESLGENLHCQRELPSASHEEWVQLGFEPRTSQVTGDQSYHCIPLTYLTAQIPNPIIDLPMCFLNCFCWCIWWQGIYHRGTVGSLKIGARARCRG
jgi:hypothetical protein